MLVHQGAASFRIWTKMRAPIEVMIKATLENLTESNTFEEEEN